MPVDNRAKTPVDNSNKIVEIARTWLGTKFHYTGRVKKNGINNGGVDCIGLIIKVGEEIDFCANGKNIINYDYLDYSRYPDHKEMRNFLDSHFKKITKMELSFGDIIYLNFQNMLEHVAIFSDIGMIHCYVEAGKVVEHRINTYWQEKIVGYYRFE